MGQGGIKSEFIFIFLQATVLWMTEVLGISLPLESHWLGPLCLISYTSPVYLNPFAPGLCVVFHVIFPVVPVLFSEGIPDSDLSVCFLLFLLINTPMNNNFVPVFICIWVDPVFILAPPDNFGLDELSTWNYVRSLVEPRPLWCNLRTSDTLQNTPTKHWVTSLKVWEPHV